LVSQLLLPIYPREAYGYYHTSPMGFLILVPEGGRWRGEGKRERERERERERMATNPLSTQSPSG
jgi:hypothetical protein